MTESDILTVIEKRQERIENSIEAINEQIAFLIERGVTQSELKFPGNKRQFGQFAPGNIRIAARIG